jgi:L-ribulose-5-phosphate 3-epimerase
MLMPSQSASNRNPSLGRRDFLALGAGAVVARPSSSVAREPGAAGGVVRPVVRPPAGKRLLLACKLGMIPKKLEGRELSLVERLRMAGDAGLDGVDFDQAGEWTPEEARAAVCDSGVFVHNAINHAHWQQRLTSEKEEDRNQGRANIDHCLRVSHAAGGSAVLIVVGQGTDGPAEIIEERCRQEIRRLIPLAAALGQMILVENVGNRMMYDYNEPPEQRPDRFIRFVDSFHSPWVGMYYDIGNHYRYGQPGDWIRAFGRRCVKLDVKGSSRTGKKGPDIASENDEIPWADVRKALDEIGYAGWATAEVKGGDLARLTQVRQQLQKAFGL